MEKRWRTMLWEILFCVVRKKFPRLRNDSIAGNFKCFISFDVEWKTGGFSEVSSWDLHQLERQLKGLKKSVSNLKILKILRNWVKSFTYRVKLRRKFPTKKCHIFYERSLTQVAFPSQNILYRHAISPSDNSSIIQSPEQAFALVLHARVCIFFPLSVPRNIESINDFFPPFFSRSRLSSEEK